jgi:hypothetical protein
MFLESRPGVLFSSLDRRFDIDSTGPAANSPHQFYASGDEMAAGRCKE